MPAQRIWGPVAVFAVLGLMALTVSADVIDIVGGTSNSGGSSHAKGNAFRVDTGTTLIEQEFYLSFTGVQTLNYYVYEAPQEFGTYTQIRVSAVTHTGVGAEWYSSGPLNVPLEAGKYYILAFSWPATVQYYYNIGDTQDVSFGAYVHGHATGTHPMSATIDSTSNDQAIYYQRLTTPEPASVLLLALGLLVRRR